MVIYEAEKFVGVGLSTGDHARLGEYGTLVLDARRLSNLAEAECVYIHLGEHGPVLQQALREAEKEASKW